MVYKDEDGEKYKISFSEELQVKNLRASKTFIKWEKRNFYAKILLIIIMFVLTLAILYVFWRIDQAELLTHLANLQ